MASKPIRQRSSAMSGVLLLWARMSCDVIKRLVPSVLREICLYFDTTRLPDVVDDKLFVYEVESNERVSYSLSLGLKERPPLIRMREAAFIFACGPLCKFQTDQAVYRVSFFAQVQKLADSPYGYSKPAAMHDDMNDYIYLFGGASDTGKSRSVQVYDPQSNRWTVIRATMRFARSDFWAVKHNRCAYILGGCDQQSVEVFDLDTGESTIQFHEFPTSLITECVGVIDGVLVCIKDLQIMELNLAIHYAYCNRSGEYYKFTDRNRRVWVLGRLFFIMTTDCVHKFRYTLLKWPDAPSLQ